jgi:hypothetical protein
VSYGIFIQAYNARKGCSHANIVSLNYLRLIFLSIRYGYIPHPESNSDIVLCVLTIMCMRYRTYAGIEQNIVNLAGSTLDFVNGLDMNSSSIRAQILPQNFQGKLLTDACHFIQSSIKMASRLLLFITVHLVMFNLQYCFQQNK